jgi:cystathionine beta-lyase/cystathionine gamma-synthase
VSPLGRGRGAYTEIVDFETRAIHEGQQPDPATGALVTPIYQTSTYLQEEVGKNKGYDYSRAGNPTRTALETCLASLESADHGAAFSSGLGGVTTLMHLVSPGERVVSVNDVYGGVYRMFTQVYEPKGYRFTFVSADEIREGLARHLDEDTRIVWLETPTNPLLNIIDIGAAAEQAHALGAMVVVDNTFATPYLQRPLELGADVVVHSTTKYLGGHSDVIGGFVATNDPTIAERLRHVASWLDEHESVDRVLYPGLPAHPGHEVAARQMSAFGGMISFLAASEEDAIRVVAETKIWKLAESLGGVESLIEQPARMTHASTADAPFAVPGNLVRLSVGIESVDDLVADLEQAFAAIRARVS